MNYYTEADKVIIPALLLLLVVSLVELYFVWKGQAPKKDY